MIGPLKDILAGNDVPLFRNSNAFTECRNENSQQPEAEIYCDGASSGNPGHAGIGVVLRFRGKLQVKRTPRDRSPESNQKSQKHLPLLRRDQKISQYIGVATNNVAEYTALIRGIKEAGSFGLKRIEIFLDSELLVKQIKGIYRVKSAKLRPFWEEAQKILRQFDSYKVTHVRRELNKEADLLAKKAIKIRQKKLEKLI